MGEGTVLLETLVDGQTVAPLLSSQPARFADVMEQLVCWLESWNRATLLLRPLDRELLEREILRPAALLAPQITGGKEYQEWLKARCDNVEGLCAPLVATHNDLTMWNVLLDEQQNLGVIDWEAAQEEGFPLVDYFYAVTDAAMAAQGSFDRPRAFESCFGAGGAFAARVEQSLRRLKGAVSIEDDLAELAFHACWLHHAANEQRATNSSDPRPFLKIVQLLALHGRELSIHSRHGSDNSVRTPLRDFNSARFREFS
jgi:hypothetical protein